MKRLIRKIGLVLVSGTIIFSGAACSASAPVDEIGLKYGGGPIEGNHFEGVVNPGSGAQFLGPEDTIKWLPVGQRNYIVSKKADEGDREGEDFIRVPAKGGIDMDFEVSVYFTLNTDTDTIEVDGKDYDGGNLRLFWERIGKKYKADTDDGWDRLLNDNFRKIIETSMRQLVFKYSVEELYANQEGPESGTSDAILQIQKDIGRGIRENINRVLGGEYFCGPNHRRGQDCSKSDFEFIINSALPAEKAVRDSFAAKLAAVNNGQAKKAEAEGTKAAQDALQGSLTPEYINYLEAQAMQDCAKRPECTLIFSNGGSGVNVNTRTGG